MFKVRQLLHAMKILSLWLRYEIYSITFDHFIALTMNEGSKLDVIIL